MYAYIETGYPIDMHNFYFLYQLEYIKVLALGVSHVWHVEGPGFYPTPKTF